MSPEQELTNLNIDIGDAEKQRDKDTLNSVGASWNTIGADYIARDAITLLKEAGILESVTHASVLTKYEDAIRESICYPKVKP